MTDAAATQFWKNLDDHYQPDLLFGGLAPVKAKATLLWFALSDKGEKQCDHKKLIADFLLHTVGEDVPPIVRDLYSLYLSEEDVCAMHDLNWQVLVWAELKKS